MSAVVIGVGNPFRRDDGAGTAIAAMISERDLPGVRVVSCDAEPSRLLDAWADTDLAIVVDAMHCARPVPGQVHRREHPQDWPQTGAASTHGLGIAQAVRLGQLLDAMPRRLVLYAVEAQDYGYGPGLSAEVSAALPGLAAAVLAELTASLAGAKVLRHGP
jgi:hydrogenase maturation protease